MPRRPQTELQRRLRAEIRARHPMSMRRISLDMGMHPNVLSKLLRGETVQPRLETLQPLARYFGWSMRDVQSWVMPLRGADPPAPPDPLEPVKEQLRHSLAHRFDELVRELAEDGEWLAVGTDLSPAAIWQSRMAVLKARLLGLGHAS